MPTGLRIRPKGRKSPHGTNLLILSLAMGSAAGTLTGQTIALGDEGQRLDEYMTGLENGGFSGEELAVGYRGDRKWGTVIEKAMRQDGPGWHLRGNGGIHSTLGDMLRWQRALVGETILSPEAKKKYFTAWIDEGGGDSFYGYGWGNVPDYMGRKLIIHNGGNGIFSADFRWFPDDEVVICAFTNLSDFSPVDDVTRDLSRMVLDFENPFNHPPDPPHPSLSAPQSTLFGNAPVTRQ